MLPQHAKTTVNGDTMQQILFRTTSVSTKSCLLLYRLRSLILCLPYSTAPAHTFAKTLFS